MFQACRKPLFVQGQYSLHRPIISDRTRLVLSVMLTHADIHPGVASRLRVRSAGHMGAPTRAFLAEFQALCTPAISAPFIAIGIDVYRLLNASPKVGAITK